MRKVWVALMFAAVMAFGFMGIQVKATEAVQESGQEEPLVQSAAWQFEVKNEELLTVSSRAITSGDYSCIYVEYKGDVPLGQVANRMFYEDGQSLDVLGGIGADVRLYGMKAFEGEKTLQIAVFDNVGNLLAGTEKTVKAEAYTGGIEQFTINPLEMSCKLNGTLPVKNVAKEDLKVELLDGDKLVGTMEPDGTSDGYHVTYLQSHLGLGATLWADNRDVTYFFGTLYVTGRLEEGKNYTLRAVVNDTVYTLGSLLARQEAEVITLDLYYGAMDTDKPLVMLQYGGTSPDRLTIEIRNEKGEVLATSNGGQRMEFTLEDSLYKFTQYELITSLGRKELLNNTSVYVLDSINGEIYYTYNLLENAFRQNIFGMYYDYLNGTVVMRTAGMPDDTEISVKISSGGVEYTAVGKVKSNQVTCVFYYNGVQESRLPVGQYKVALTSKVPGGTELELLGLPDLIVEQEEASLGGNLNTDNNTSFLCIESDKNSYEFSYTLGKNEVPEAGEFTAEVAQMTWQGYQTVGTAFAMNATERLGEDGVTVYDLTGTWNGDNPLSSDVYTLLIYRGNTLVKECDLSVLKPDVTWGYIDCNVINSDTARVTAHVTPLSQNQSIDKNKIALQVYDLLGGSADIKIEAIESKDANGVAYKLSGFGNLGGITLKATYDGKEIYDYMKPSPNWMVFGEVLEEKVIFNSYESIFKGYNDSIKNYVTTGLAISGDVRVEVREVGTMKVLKTMELKADLNKDVTYVPFTEGMLSGLVTNGSVQYWFSATKANGEFMSRIQVYPAVNVMNEEESKLVTVPAKEQNPEQVEGFVSRMYTVALGREADKGGLEDWTNKLLKGEIQGSGIADGFVKSTEMKNKNLDDGQYLDTLYNAFFGRPADEGGKNDWLKRMSEGMSREEVLAGFSNSDEFGNLCDEFGITQGVMKADGVPVNAGIVNFVERAYNNILGRESDMSGLMDWTTQIDRRAKAPTDVVTTFFITQEYVNKDYNNSDYVEILYLTFMGRPSDQGGKAYWLNKIANEGWSRDKVLMEGFVPSSEFAGILQSYGLQ